VHATDAAEGLHGADVDLDEGDADLDEADAMRTGT
jgi:hypothetical protein